jgi:hypothetical protein
MPECGDVWFEGHYLLPITGPIGIIIALSAGALVEMVRV